MHFANRAMQNVDLVRYFSLNHDFSVTNVPLFIYTITPFKFFKTTVFAYKVQYATVLLFSINIFILSIVNKSAAVLLYSAPFIETEDAELIPYNFGKSTSVGRHIMNIKKTTHVKLSAEQ